MAMIGWTRLLHDLPSLLSFAQVSAIDDLQRRRIRKPAVPSMAMIGWTRLLHDLPSLLSFAQVSAIDDLQRRRIRKPASKPSPAPIPIAAQGYCRTRRCPLSPSSRASSAKSRVRSDTSDLSARAFPPSVARARCHPSRDSSAVVRNNASAASMTCSTLRFKDSSLPAARAVSLFMVGLLGDNLIIGLLALVQLTCIKQTASVRADRAVYGAARACDPFCPRATRRAKPLMCIKTAWFGEQH